MRGAVYYAVRNSRHVKLAAQSAKSLRRHMPNLHITLFTDLPVNRRVFDSIEPMPPVSESRCGGKMFALGGTPYDATLFLDADTWVCGNLSEIFEAVEDDRIDLLAPMVQQHRHVHKLDWIFEEAGVPQLFPRHACGVMGLAKNRRTDALLERWTEHYEELIPRWVGTMCPVQPSLRVALYRCPFVRAAPLNACYDYLLYGYLNRPVKVIHWKGNEKQLRAWEKEVNRRPRSPRYMRNGKRIAEIAQ